MKHCTYCGGLTTQYKNKHTCNLCSKTFYDNPKATVAIILYTADKKQMIFGVRAHDPEKGKLDCIGGFLDIGETFEQAIYREMQEEVGLTKDDIGELVYVGSGADPYPWEGEIVFVTGVYFSAPIKDGAILKPADDVAEVLFRSIDELEGSEDFAWQSMKANVFRAVQLLAEM